MTLRPFAAPGTPARWVRPRSFRVSHVSLDITIDLDARRVAGEAAHRVEFLPHGADRTLIELDQHDLAIEAVTVDGREARWSLAPGRLAVAVPDGTGEACTVAVRFACERPQKGLFFVPAAGEERAMAWTQGAMEDHHHWFPCWDDPNNLCTLRLAVRHRAGLQAVANGERRSRQDHGDGWATTVYEQPRPHVLYLLNLVVGDLVEVVDGAGPVPVAHWLPRGHEAKAPAMFRATAFAIRWLGAFTGTPFPWTRYGHAVVHRFMWGGMENATLTTITDRVLMDAADQQRDDVDCDALVIHELVHQWYGDLMTMKGWSDIWLNESFATWLEARCTAAWRAEQEGAGEADGLARALWANRAAYLAEDGGRYRRALVTNRWDDAYELFDRVAYEKGSLVLEQLAGQLGEERLRAAVALYTRRHAHGLVETGDWRRALEDATGEPLDWWFDQWVLRPGHPEIKVRCQHDPRRGVLCVTIEQTHEGEPWRLPLELAWAGGGSARIELDQARQVAVLPCPLAPAWVATDPRDRLAPVVWDEDGSVAELGARLRDAGLGAACRARAAAVLGRRPGVSAAVAALAAALGDAGAPELVRQECIAALGALRTPPAAEALLAAYPGLRPRLRRAAAEALGGFRGLACAGDLARRLLELGDGETSPVTAGACFAARGALEHPGAAPELRRRMERPSWGQRLRIGCVRGLGACGEAAALDDVLPLLGQVEGHEGVLCAACAAAAELGRRHAHARERVRRALEALLVHDGMHVRSAAAGGIARLGDAAASGALAAALAREPFGNVKRTLREAADDLRRAGDLAARSAELERRVDELDKQRKALETRLEALEKRLG